MTIGSKIIYHANVSSTNDVASDMILSGSAIDGTVISAGFQLRGKGQRNNQWYSDPFMNLIMSVIMVPENIEPEDQFYLSKIVSLALTDVLGKYSDKFRIKWPNDIYHEGDKIAGILIENTIIGSNISSCVAGIGININQKEFPGDLPNPVSLYQLSGNRYNVQVIQDDVCKQLEKWYTALRDKELDSINNLYLDRLYLLGKDAEFETSKGRISGVIRGVNKSGQLEVTTPDGESSTYSFKEIEFCGQAKTSQ